LARSRSRDAAADGARLRESIPAGDERDHRRFAGGWLPLYRRRMRPQTVVFVEPPYVCWDRRMDRVRDGRSTIERDEFLAATLSVWEIPPESARRVGHPAPFPVALPRRFIELYTFDGDLVLDPFMGSGSTAVAAVEGGRHYVGYDTDPAYVALAEERVRAASAG